ncbi:Hypothetical protein SMAX5B_007852 [Scophthalmus maximus]|uniref:Uncharacterized protein n=1 Tax=Scophthalmus maximus TaxID=52904 RepID=A0A2U9C4Y5_SCOMX|nr:Hypothetical protein SMAX5B_007852 [Scophthalmus maximus]
MCRVQQGAGGQWDEWQINNVTRAVAPQTEKEKDVPVHHSSPSTRKNCGTRTAVDGGVRRDSFPHPGVSRSRRECSRAASPLLSVCAFCSELRPRGGAWREAAGAPLPARCGASRGGVRGLRRGPQEGPVPSHFLQAKPHDRMSFPKCQHP